MSKSYAKILGSIASSTMLLAIGATSAADLPSGGSIDSGPAKEFVQEQEQAQYRDEEQRRRQMDSSSGSQAQSMEQQRRKAQARSQQRMQLPDSGEKGMAMGGGRR